MGTHQYNYAYILRLTLVSALGGLLFGYDWVVIGGAKPFYELFFGISHSPNLQGWAMSSALIGCLFGALISGVLSERFGRKLPLIFAATLFTASAIGTGAVNSFVPFIAYRVLGGLGIGLASAISPMYIAEIAPARIRGKLVSVNQLTIVIGILLAQITNYLIAEKTHADMSASELMGTWNVLKGWRWMFWAEVVPASLFFILAFLLPESPRYLVKAGRLADSTHILQRIGGKDYAFEESTRIQDSLRASAHEQIDWRALREHRMRPVLVIGIILAIFQQWCGINVIFNYAHEVFTSAGYSVTDMLFNIVITGTVNLVFTLLAMRMVDSWGRKKLLLLGSLGLALIYLLLGASYYFQLQGAAILLLVVTAIAVYALTLAPIVWVVLSEIFPNRIRGAAMAIATTALWVASFLLTYSFPILNNVLKASGTFWLYGVICLGGFVFILKKLPETKGKTLEDLEQELTISKKY